MIGSAGFQGCVDSNFGGCNAETCIAPAPGSGANGTPPPAENAVESDRAVAASVGTAPSRESDRFVPHQITQ